MKYFILIRWLEQPWAVQGPYPTLTIAWTTVEKMTLKEGYTLEVLSNRKPK